jgi:hemolysin activation/secretion protein
VSQGLTGFGATDEGTGRSRTNGQQDYTKFNMDLSRLQNLPYGFSLLTAASGQYTNDALLTSEQFALGGVGFGQAYDSGELSGDKGLAGKVELRYGQPVGAQWFDSYQLYGFYDIGSVYVNEAASGTDSKMSLASTGVGVRTNFTPNLYGYLELGFPLTHQVASEGDEDPRLFFSITGRY